MKFYPLILFFVTAGILGCNSLHAQYTADIRMGPTSNGFFLLNYEDRESNVRPGAGGYVSISLKQKIRRTVYLRYGMEFRQFNAGWDFYQLAGKASYAIDLDFSVSYLSAIVGIEEGIWIREKFRLSTQFGLIPSYQLTNRVSGVNRNTQFENHHADEIADFHLGLRPGLFFIYRLTPGLSFLAEAA